MTKRKHLLMTFCSNRKLRLFLGGRCEVKGGLLCVWPPEQAQMQAQSGWEAPGSPSLSAKGNSHVGVSSERCRVRVSGPDKQSVAVQLWVPFNLGGRGLYSWLSSTPTSLTHTRVCHMWAWSLKGEPPVVASSDLWTYMCLIWCIWDFILENLLFIHHLSAIHHPLYPSSGSWGSVGGSPGQWR